MIGKYLTETIMGNTITFFTIGINFTKQEHIELKLVNDIQCNPDETCRCSKQRK